MIKKIYYFCLVTLGCFINQKVHASESGADITCMEQETSFRYDFNTKKKTFTAQDELGQIFDKQEDLNIKVDHLETFPKQSRYVFYTKLGLELAQIVFSDGQIIGYGIMTDNDSKMSCINKK